MSEAGNSNGPGLIAGLVLLGLVILSIQYWFVTVPAIIILLVAVAAYNRRTKKKCPDCLNVAPAGANVCTHCGYRFAP